jgi:hypothetical protein
VRRKFRVRLPCLLPSNTTPLHCRYDGYRLTYLGYDFLAIKTLVNRGSIAGVGRQVGVAPPRSALLVCDSPQQQCLRQSATLFSWYALASRMTWLHFSAPCCGVLGCADWCGQGERHL